MTALETAVQGALTTALSAGGQSVTLRRSSDGATAQATAVLMYRTGEATPGGAVVENYETWDFLLFASAFKFGSEAASLPEIGDKVELEDGSTFQVAPLPGEKHYRFDGSPQALLIHTKPITPTEEGGS
jgi:hypothetical protein